jgi:hypothetical protein
MEKSDGIRRAAIGIESIVCLEADLLQSFVINLIQDIVGGSWRRYVRPAAKFPGPLDQTIERKTLASSELHSLAGKC